MAPAMRLCELLFADSHARWQCRYEELGAGDMPLFLFSVLRQDNSLS